MRFLRDQVLQGASFFIAVLVMLLQFPEHLVWLLPLTVLFIMLLYVGHKYSSETNLDNSKTSGDSLKRRTISFSKNWLMPSITIFAIIVSTFFTARGIYTKFVVGTTREKSGIVEKLEFQVTRDTNSIQLDTIVTNKILRDKLYLVNPEIIFKDNSGFLSAQIDLKGLMYTELNDSGADPQNIIIEPNGDFMWTSSAVDFKPQHTIFLKVDGGDLIRIHVKNFPQLPPVQPGADYLVLIVSSISDSSQRFIGLTEP